MACAVSWFACCTMVRIVEKRSSSLECSGRTSGGANCPCNISPDSTVLHCRLIRFFSRVTLAIWSGFEVKKSVLRKASMYFAIPPLTAASSIP